MTTAKGIADAKALLGICELTGIRFWEESVRRQATETPADPTASSDAHEAGIRISTKIGANETELHFRFRLNLDDVDAKYVCDIETIFALTEHSTSEVTEEVRREFAEKVAFMVAFSHMRASILGSAGRLGIGQPVLPLMRLGEFSIGSPVTPENAETDYS
ncbi:MAG: hypothetical protein JW722_08035 [Demequinaceae bacterium]|nr:hypothetical protein [Demequinaceae bacterium]